MFEGNLLVKTEGVPPIRIALLPPGGSERADDVDLHVGGVRGRVQHVASGPSVCQSRKKRRLLSQVRNTSNS